MFGMSYYQNYHLGLSFDLTRKVVLRKNYMADMFAGDAGCNTCKLP